jgi:ABC-2 type transport system permease protein
MSAEAASTTPPRLALLRTELLKLSTTRMPWLLAASVLALTAVLALQPVLGAGRNGSPSIGTVGATLGVLDAMGRGPLAALVFSVLVVTSDFRHKTVATSLLQAPNRIRLIGAKTAAAALLGLALGTACLVVVALVGAVTGALQFDLVNADIALRGLGLVVTYPLYALLGTGVGALLRGNQPLAIILPLAWLVGAEPLALSGLPPSAAAWSLGGLTAALQNAADLPFILPFWSGAGALLAFALVLLLTGAQHLNHHDIS